MTNEEQRGIADCIAALKADPWIHAPLNILRKLRSKEATDA